MQLSVRISGLSGVQDRFKASGPVARRQLTRATERSVLIVERDLKTRTLRGTKGNDSFWGVTGASGEALGVRTGHSRRSIVSRVLSSAFKVVGVVGSALKQMALHEHGGTIHGKPWLRIPTQIMKTGSGVDRLAGQSAKSLPNTKIIKSRAGNLWITEVGTARSKLAVELQGFPLMLYMLVHAITLRPRHMFRNTLRHSQAAIRNEYQAAAAATAKAMGGK